MSSRSRIGILKEDGSIDSIYCHNYGEIKYNGTTLQLYYNSLKQAEELVKLGNISILGKYLKPNPNYEHSFVNKQNDTTVAYCRDRKENWNQNKPHYDKNIEEFIKTSIGSWAINIYLYDTTNQKWLCGDPVEIQNDIKNLLPLEEKLNALVDDNIDIKI